MASERARRREVGAAQGEGGARPRVGLDELWGDRDELRGHRGVEVGHLVSVRVRGRVRGRQCQGVRIRVSARVRLRVGVLGIGVLGIGVLGIGVEVGHRRAARAVACAAVGGDAHLAEIWRRYGGNMAEIWRRYGGDMAEIWRRYGGDVGEM